MASIAERIHALFAGFQGAHGTHGEPEQEPESPKWGIKRTARTLSGPPSVALWESHIKGTKPLGVAPVQEDSMCVWGSVDIDDYYISIPEMVARVESLKLPLVPCRSKSGGLHLFLFLSEPVPAIDVQRYLKSVAAQLGYTNSEVFPKQTEILVSRGDKPNWILMPYFGSDYGGKLMLQVGVKRTGGEQTIEEFLSFAEGRRVARTGLAAPRKARRAAAGADVAQGAPVAGEPFSDGPPCLQHLAAGGVKPGGQNNCLLMMGIYYKRKYPVDWREHLERGNHEHLDPPGASEGVALAIRSLQAKDYNYTCKTEPMKSHCNSSVCRVRRYGVGEEGAFPVISGMAKLDTDPPIWFINVEEARLEVSTDTLQNYPRFHAVCMERLNKCYMALKQSDWLTALGEAMRDIHLIDTPGEVGKRGVLHEMLEEFLTNRQRGTAREDLLRGRPWEDETDHVHYFRLKDFAKHLVREGDKTTTRAQLATFIRSVGGDTKFTSVKNRGFNVWWVPSGAIETTTDSGDPPPVRGVPV